jgi:hypothetical protein
MRRCEMLLSKILKAEDSLFDDIPRRKEMICMSGGLVLIVAISVLANRGLVNGLTAWSIDGQLQLDDGGENS